MRNVFAAKVAPALMCLRSEGYNRGDDLIMKLLVVFTVGLCLFLAPAVYATGTLQLTVVVIADDLSIKPVPDAHFALQQEEGNAPPVLIATGLSGSCETPLQAGKYVLSSASPVTYMEKSLTWTKTFAVEDGKTVALQLTSNEAAVTKRTPGGALSNGRQLDESAAIYRDCKDGVVTIETDTGHGSGFIIGTETLTQACLIVTNSHVVDGSTLVRVRLCRGQKVKAVLISQDKQTDIAFVGADLSSFKNVKALRLASRAGDEPLAVEGEKVAAIGSPLNQDKIVTSGIVSKVETGAILSDVNINHGNSGGPLLNMAGEVIGITTFGDFSNQGGPGVSGIVPITEVIRLRQEADAKLKSTQIPQSILLPDVPDSPFPVQALTDAAKVDLKPHHLKAPRNFETFILTPPVVESMNTADARLIARGKQARDRRKGAQGVTGGTEAAQHKVWEEYVGECDALVTVVVNPVAKSNQASAIGAAFGALVGARVPVKQEFRDDFYRMELLHGDDLVEPIYAFRRRFYMNEFGLSTYGQDMAYGGLCCYDVSAFEPSKAVKFRVYKETNISKYDEYTLPKDMQQKIWADFAPYRVANRSGD